MVLKIVSGGQTGVDRGALDAALDRGFQCGGWCPRGRRAEAGAIPARYPLQENASTRYLDRTRRNVEDSDATLILAPGRLKGGTRATRLHALAVGKPVLVVDLNAVADVPAIDEVVEWIARLDLEGANTDTLNIAGPRESGSPGITAQTRCFVGALLDRFSSS